MPTFDDGYLQRCTKCGERFVSGIDSDLCPHDMKEILKAVMRKVVDMRIQEEDAVLPALVMSDIVEVLTTCGVRTGPGEL